MPLQGPIVQQEFTLNAAGVRRVRVSRAFFSDPLTVLLDNSVIGSLSQEEFVTGWEFPLKDGSVLKVQVVKNQVQVLRNGLALSEAGVDVEQRAKKAAIGKRRMKGGLRCLALALILAIVGSIFLNSSGAGAAAATLGTGLLAAATPLLFAGLIFLLSGFFTWRGLELRNLLK